MRFQLFDRVKAAGNAIVGRISSANVSAFGETYWIVWDDGQLTLMHGDNLEKANVDFQPEKP